MVGFNDVLDDLRSDRIQYAIDAIFILISCSYDG